MASAGDNRLAAARLMTVAAASRLSPATEGSQNSYTTSRDTTKPRVRAAAETLPSLATCRKARRSLGSMSSIEFRIERYNTIVNFIIEYVCNPPPRIAAPAPRNCHPGPRAGVQHRPCGPATSRQAGPRIVPGSGPGQAAGALSGVTKGSKGAPPPRIVTPASLNCRPGLRAGVQHRPCGPARPRQAGPRLGADASSGATKGGSAPAPLNCHPGLRAGVQHRPCGPATSRQAGPRIGAGAYRPW